MRKKVLFLENQTFNSDIVVGSHHYAKLFSKDNDVLWISLPWHIFQLIKDKNSDRFKNWNLNKPQIISDSLSVFTPFVPFPYRDFPILKSSFLIENYINYMPGLKKLLKKSGFDNPDLIWITDPRHISILNFVKETPIIYRCVDNLEHFSDVPKSLLKIEQDLIKRTQITFFTSQDLKRKFNQLNQNSYYLPNGCDYDFFSHKNKVLSESSYDKHLKKDKINILYMGTIAEWFDFDVIENAALNDKYNFLIIGPIRTRIPSNVQKKHNIIFTGALPYSAMPIYVSNAHIGIIPFKVNEMTDCVNPIKLYEYCSGGLNVISSNFKTVSKLDGPFFKYKNKNDFAIILEELSKNLYAKFSKEKILEFAKSNSWEKRYEYVLKKIKF